MTRIFNYPVGIGVTTITMPVGKFRLVTHTVSSAVSGTIVLAIGSNMANLPVSSSRYFMVPGDSMPISEGVSMSINSTKAGFIQLLYDD